MKNVTLLDASIIVLGSCALSLFLLWGAGEFAGITIFADPPGYLRAIAHNLFSVATTGAFGATLLTLLRKQIAKGTTPHYLLIIPIGTAIIIGAVIVISRFIPPDRNAEHKTKISAAELTKKTETGESEPYGTSYLIRSHFFNSDNHSELQVKSIFNAPDEEIAACEKKYGAPDGVKDQGLEDIDQCNPGSFEIIENGISKFRISDFKINFNAICKARDGLTTFLLNRWNGSATTEGPIVSVKFDPNTNRFKETMVLSQGYISDDDDDQKNTLVNCRAGQKSFDLNEGLFPLCNCTFEQAASIRALTDEFFSSKIFGKTDGISIERAEPYLDMAYEELPKEKICAGKTVRLNDIENYNPNLHIYDKDLKAFISAIENVGPQLAKEIDETYGKTNMTPFFVNELQGESVALTSIVYSEGNESWSAALMKRYDSGTWSIFHVSKFGYKVLQPLNLVKHLGKDRFLVDICVHSCSDHWGIRIKSIFDAKNKTFMLDRSDPENKC